MLFTILSFCFFVFCLYRVFKNESITLYKSVNVIQLGYHAHNILSNRQYQKTQPESLYFGIPANYPVEGITVTLLFSLPFLSVRIFVCIFLQKCAGKIGIWKPKWGCV